MKKEIRIFMSDGTYVDTSAEREDYASALAENVSVGKGVVVITDESGNHFYIIAAHVVRIQVFP